MYRYIVVHVQPKDETTDAANGNSSASVGVLTELMPSGTTPLVIADARGGMAARWGGAFLYKLIFLFCPNH